LLAELPRVASVNILPVHAALLAGEREIPLTAAQALRMRLNGIDLWLRPQGFFQTNSTVAAALYRQVAAWVSDEPAASAWDLYCGIGGFALHAAGPGAAHVLGVETSAAAVTGARAAAAGAGLDVRFVVGDAERFAVSSSPDERPGVVIVNPPRRGIGPALATWLETSGVPHVLYSSCRLASLAADLAAMPSLRPVRGRLLDMFPQTPHHEVVVELRRGA
ncbi:MAG: methyltransferase domain-containing protein, partial [Micrococcales bacterium]|nr:methyltransferase domain-containing protein [Micrococcales bacterium]